MVRKQIATLLAVMMIFTIMAPFSELVYAAGTSIVTVESVTDTAGATVEVKAVIENNPGIMGATLKLTYDSGLTLLSAENGEAFDALSMTKSASLASPCKFVWDGQELQAEDIKDGTILTLQFKIDENAAAGDVYDVNLSYDSGDIFDSNVELIDISIQNGSVSVVDYLPGDLNGDQKVNSGDIILLRRHVAGGYAQTINEAAGDVNNDGKKNSGDIILIRRYIAGGYGVVLMPSGPQCSHELTAHAYKAQTCTEDGNIAYWSCSKCSKLFSDANATGVVTQSNTVLAATGHTVVIDVAVEATYTSTGLTEGKHCSVCSEVLLAQEVIPVLQKDEYSINYYIYGNDDYLASLDIANPNPATYSKQEGLVLQDLHVAGYSFVGWFTAQVGGTQVTEIAAGTTGTKTLYAHWEKATYTVQFASDMVPQADMTFTAGEERTLPKPVLDRYTFVGWSDKDGKMWESIPKGTAKNVVLYANWASNRNRAVAVSQLADPIICEDSEAGLMLFTYEIGEITNVPLYEIMRLNCVNGLISTVSTTTSQEISTTQAKSIAQTISNATTNSASWTLENNWNNTTEVSQTYLDQTGQTREEAESLAKSESGTYNLSTSNGGSNGYTDTSSGAYSLSGNQAHSNTSTTESGQNFGLSVDAKFSKETSISAEASIEMVNLNAGNKYGFEIGAGADYGDYVKNTNTGTDSWSNGVDISNETSNTTTAEKNWNTSEGYSNSKTTSTNSTVANAVSKLISEQYGYGSSYAEGGSNSSSQALASTDTKSDEYSTTMTYHTSQIESVSKSVSTSGETVGDYRYVMAGTIHVFAIVGYDVAERSYFVYTYNVLDDTAYEYVDYSFDGTFNDYETSIIPFEIPHFVNDYVNTRIAKTAGLQIDPDTGIIENYIPNSDKPDTIVVIPSYIAVDNGDGTFTSVKVKGIADGLFKNNTDLVGVKLGNFITEIPDSAFEGCSSLKYVVTPGVTKIGDNAFKGCSALSDFTVPADVTAIGTNAFSGVPKVSAVAATASVAQAVAASGAANIVLDISSVPDSEADGMTFEVGEIISFELQGKDKEYSGLSVTSNAETTVINGVKFVDCTEIPMVLASANVTLNRVTATTNGLALVLEADSTNLKLNQTVTLTASLGKAVLCKDVSLSSLSSSVVGKLKLTGDMLVAGEVSGTSYITFDSGEIVYITAEQFENYRSSCNVFFDANGGTVSTASTQVTFNSAIGTLPTPTYGEYTFLGWYTEKVGGTKVTADTVIASEMTIYAHWNNWDGTSAEPAYNASTKTYTITNGSELAWVSDVSNGVITSGTNFPTDITFAGYTIELANDIYLNDTTGWENWETTAPANSWTPIKKYTGELEGNSYNIFGIYCGGEKTHGALVRGADAAVIRNINIDKSYISGNQAAGIVSYASNSTHIYNCTSNATIYGVIIGGGIVSNCYEATVENCVNYGQIYTDYGAGGIAYAVEKGAIISCINKGEIVNDCKNDVRGTGGIVGLAEDSAKIEKCVNLAKIYAGYKTGGIAGEMINASLIEECSNRGEIYCPTLGYSVGGIVGEIHASTIYAVENSGKITGVQRVGGIAGYASPDIQNCDDVCLESIYNIGAVNGDNYVAGLVGQWSYNGTYRLKLYFCYCSQSTLYNTSEYGAEYVTSRYCSRKSLSEMKSIEMPDALSGLQTSPWAVDSNINNGYPYLKALADTY